MQGGEAFYVHKDIIVKDSKYFEGALRSSFVEGETQEIAFDDISSHDFGLYVDVLYRAYLNDRFRLRDDHMGGAHTSLFQSLVLFQLADRFMNDALVRVAREGLEFRFQYYSVPNWMRAYTAEVKARDGEKDSSLSKGKRKGHDGAKGARAKGSPRSRTGSTACRACTTTASRTGCPSWTRPSPPVLTARPRCTRAPSTSSSQTSWLPFPRSWSCGTPTRTSARVIRAMTTSLSRSAVTAARDLVRSPQNRCPVA